MKNKILFGRSRREILTRYLPLGLLLSVFVLLAIRYVNPAPPRRVVFAAGDHEGDYAFFAKQYKDLMAKEGIDLEIRATSGSAESAKLIIDPNSDVDVGFVHDGTVTEDQVGKVESLGSMYYEPLWIFYRSSLQKPGAQPFTRLAQFTGRRIALGEKNSGTSVLARRLLEASGVTEKNSQFVFRPWNETEKDLRSADVDVAFLIATPEDGEIEALIDDPAIKVVSLDQAEAMTRQLPFLHHLVLPHGTISLQHNLPPYDLDMVAPTATILAKSRLHPALVYLLLKAATKVHSDSGILEKAGEFPSDKDYEIAINDEAAQFYKHGIPLWQRYLPFWLATLIERLLVVAVPFFAIILPGLRLIPRFFQWRARNKILARYGELKFLETQIRAERTHEKFPEHLRELAKIEDRVDAMKVSLDFAEHVYGLREHIHFVRERLRRDLEMDQVKAKITQ